MAQQDSPDWFADGEAYERYVGRWSRPIGRLFLEWLSLPNGLSWADVGCGTGALTELLLQSEAPRRVIGVDPSAGYLSFAEARISDARASFRMGSAQNLPIDPAGVDVAASGLVLNFVPDHAAAIQEMMRVVRPGGTIAAYVWDYAGEMQLMRCFWNSVVKLFADGAEKDEGNMFPICNPSALDELFRTQALVEVDTCALDAPTVFRDFDDYWSPFLRGQGPAGAYCISLSETERLRLQNHLKDALPHDAEGRISLTARAWAVRGTR